MSPALRRVRLALLSVLVGLVLAGCARSDTTSDDDRHGVFYGGVSGGMQR